VTTPTAPKVRALLPAVPEIWSVSFGDERAMVPSRFDPASCHASVNVPLNRPLYDPVHVPERGPAAAATAVGVAVVVGAGVGVLACVGALVGVGVVLFVDALHPASSDAAAIAAPIRTVRFISEVLPLFQRSLAITDVGSSLAIADVGGSLAIAPRCPHTLGADVSIHTL
jgi:hypothetical protein